jgi:hypothetical protein
MSKKQKPKDRHLDVPAESNRDKHINFIADEKSQIDPSMDPSKGLLNEDSAEGVGDKKNKFQRRNPNSER